MQAVNVPVGDLGGYFAGTEMEAVTQALGLDVSNLQTLSGRPDGSTHNGTFTGSTIPDNETTKQNLQSLETAVEAKVSSVKVAPTGMYRGLIAIDPDSLGLDINGMAAPPNIAAGDKFPMHDASSGGNTSVLWSTIVDQMQDSTKILSASYNTFSGLLTLNKADGGTVTVTSKQIDVRASAPTGTPSYPMAVDTVGTDTIYFANNGAWVRFSAGGGSGTPGGSSGQIQFNDVTFGGDAGLTYSKTADAVTITGTAANENTTIYPDSIVINADTVGSSGAGTWLRFNINKQSPYTYTPFGINWEIANNNVAPYENEVITLGPNAKGNSGTAFDATKPMASINWETSWYNADPFYEWHEIFKHPDSTHIRLKSYTINYKNAFDPTANDNFDLYHSADAFSVHSPTIWDSGPTYFAVARSRSTKSASMQLVATPNNTFTITGNTSGGEEFMVFNATSSAPKKYATWNNFDVYTYNDPLGAFFTSNKQSGFREINLGTSSVNTSMFFKTNNSNSGYGFAVCGDLTSGNPTGRGQLFVANNAVSKYMMLGMRNDISLGYIGTAENLALRGAIVELGDAAGASAPASGAKVNLNSSAANTTAILRMINTTVSGGLKFFVTNATPESALTGSPGDVAYSDAGKNYIKVTGSASTTGWFEILNASNYATTLDAAYWKLGGQTLAANANIGPTSAHRFGITTNGTARVYYSSDGRVYSNTITDYIMAASDSARLEGAGGKLDITSGFSRLYAGGTIAYQVNNSNLTHSAVIADNQATAYQVTISGGNTAIAVKSTDNDELVTIGATGMHARTAGRLSMSKGANVASANDLTLGEDGNVFHITGNTTVNAITTSEWLAGSEIILIFDGTPTVKNNTSGGAGTAVMLLAGGVDFSATANDVLKLVFDGTSWFEISRSVN